MAGLFPVRRRADFYLSHALFIASLLCVCVAEALMIRNLWFTSGSNHPHRRLDLPFLVWIPLLGEFIVLEIVRKKTREGHINPGVATSLSSGLALLVLGSYLLIARFAQIVFR